MDDELAARLEHIPKTAENLLVYFVFEVAIAAAEADNGIVLHVFRKLTHVCVQEVYGALAAFVELSRSK